MASDASQLSLYREPDWLKSITLLGQFKIHSGSLGSIHNGFGIFFIDPPEAVPAPAPLPLCGTGMAFGYGHVCIVGSPFEPIHGTSQVVMQYLIWGIVCPLKGKTAPHRQDSVSNKVKSGKQA
jgi:hypothetical protein